MHMTKETRWSSSISFIAINKSSTSIGEGEESPCLGSIRIRIRMFGCWNSLKRSQTSSILKVFWLIGSSRVHKWAELNKDESISNPSIPDALKRAGPKPTNLVWTQSWGMWITSSVIYTGPLLPQSRRQRLGLESVVLKQDKLNSAYRNGSKIGYFS